MKVSQVTYWDSSVACRMAHRVDTVCDHSNSNRSHDPSGVVGVVLERVWFRAEQSFVTDCISTLDTDLRMKMADK